MDIFGVAEFLVPPGAASPSPKEFLYISVGKQVTDVDLGCHGKGRNTKTCLQIIRKAAMTQVVHKLVSGLIQSNKVLTAQGCEVYKGNQVQGVQVLVEPFPLPDCKLPRTADAQSASLRAQQLYLPAWVLKDSAAKCTETAASQPAPPEQCLFITSSFKSSPATSKPPSLPKRTDVAEAKSWV